MACLHMSRYLVSMSFALCAVGLVTWYLSFQSSTPTATEDLRTVLGAKGSLLFEESFDAAELSTKWAHSAGWLRLNQGALAVSEDPIDKQRAKFGHAVEAQDCAVQFDFKLDDEALFLGFRFALATGATLKDGYLLSSVGVSPRGWSLIGQGDKVDAKQQYEVRATQKTTFEPDKWYTLLVESHGDNVVAQIAGKETLKVTSSHFNTKKSRLDFHVTGPNEKAVRFDNVKVWELK